MGRPITSIGRYAKQVMPAVAHKDAVQRIRRAGGVEKLSRLGPETVAVLLRYNVIRKGGGND